MKMLQAQPALPVKDMARSIGFYRDKLGLSFVLETRDSLSSAVMPWNFIFGLPTMRVGELARIRDR